MSRVYTSQFSNVSVSGTQDLFNLSSTANMAIKVHEVAIGQVTATTIGNLRLSLKRLPATVTPGTGGGGALIQAINPSDAAATSNVRVNDTSPATTNSTAQVIRSDVFNVLNGYSYLPPIEDRPIMKPSQAFIVSLDTAPGSAEFMNGSIVWEELY